MDRQVGGLIDGRTDEWMGYWIDEQTVGWVD